MKAVSTDLLSQSIVKTLLYFDIFNYPLNTKEVFRFLQTNHVTPDEIHDKLCELSDNKIAHRFGNFFCLQNNSSLIERRIRGNEEAQKYMSLAYKQAALIQKFPFVKAVMASGSLSKGYMDDNCDLDFFIVTQPKRLWIARTLLVLYKRIFLANSHKHFCVNYFIDEDSLEIEEKNLYTAIELTTLIPLTGMKFHNKLMLANQWVTAYLPNSNCEYACEEHTAPTSNKTAMEGFLNIFFPQTVNTLLMKLTLNRWKKLYADKYDKDDFQIAFKTKKSVSKNHPNYYQKKVMDLYHQKRDEFSNRYKVKWE